MDSWLFRVWSGDLVSVLTWLLGLTHFFMSWLTLVFLWEKESVRKTNILTQSRLQVMSPASHHRLINSTTLPSAHLDPWFLFSHVLVSLVLFFFSFSRLILQLWRFPAAPTRSLLSMSRGRVPRQRPVKPGKNQSW